MNLLESEIKQNFDGFLYIQKKSHKTKKNKFVFKDLEGFICDPDQTTMKFTFDYEAYLKNKAIADKVEKMNNLMKNKIVKAVLFLVMLNPICFDFIVNVLQKFIFFRALDVDPPLNLQLFYKMFSDNVNIDPFATDYDQFVEEEPKEGTKGNSTIAPEGETSSGSLSSGKDRQQQSSEVLRLIKHFMNEDQLPPFRFQALKISSLAIKTVLPSLIVLCLSYLLGLALKGIKIRNSRKYLNKSEEKFSYKWKKQSLMTNISDLIIEFVVWNYVIKTVFLLFQTMSLGVILNLANLSFKTPKRTVSSLFTLASIPIFIMIIVSFYKLMKKYKKSEGVVDDELKIIQDVKDKNIFCVHFKLYKYIIKPIVCSIGVCFFYKYPSIAAVVIGSSYFVEMGWVICFRPYRSILMNIKSFVSSTCLLLISVIYFLLTVLESESNKYILGWIVIGMVFLLLLNLLFVKIFYPGTL